MSWGRGISLVVLAVALQGAVTWALLRSGASGSTDLNRTVGSRLQGAGLKAEAARWYGRHLDARPDLPSAERATIALSIGQLLMEEGRHDEALAWLYLADIEGQGGEVAKEAGKLIVSCLERTGRGQAARSMLASRTRVSAADAPPAADTDDPVVASAGAIQVRRSAFEAFVDGLPPPMQQRLATDDGKRALLQEALAREALLEKARARGLGGDPRLKQRMMAVEQELMISGVIEQIAADRIRPGPQDLQNYHASHAEAFGGKPFEEVRADVERRYLQDRLQEIYQGAVAEALADTRIDLYPERVAGAAPAQPAAEASSPAGGSP